MKESRGYRRTVWTALLFGLIVAFLPLSLPAQSGGQAAAGTQESSPAAGQVPGIGSVSLEQLKNLRATLNDESKRKELIDQISALIAVKESGGKAGGEAEKGGKGTPLLERASARIEAISGQITELAVTVGKLPATVTATLERANDPVELRHWIIEAAKLLAVVVAAILGGWLASYLMRQARRGMLAIARNGWLLGVLAYVFYVVFTLIPTAAFVALAYALMPAADMAAATRTLTLTLVDAMALVHALTVTARLLFSPPRRLPAPFRLDDESGAYATVWTRRFALVAVYGYFITQAMGVFGLRDTSVAVLQRAIGLLLAGMAIVFIMQLRRPVADWLRRDARPRSMRGKLANTWHYLALLGVVILTAVGMLGTAGNFAEVTRSLLISLLVVFVALVLSQGVQALLDRIFQLSAELKAVYPRLEARANRYLPVLSRILKAIVYLLSLLAILQVWGLGGFTWLGTDTGQALSSHVLSIALTVAAALAVWEVITAVVEDALNKNASALDPASIQRRQTLLPLARNALRLTLIVLVTLVTFSELGINIAPLLAGAGVIGLAIGFGSQTLVQDVITGVFILVEDSVAVGDYVEVGGYSGTVESMSIRSIRLRDLEGNVHTVPFSQVSTVHNMTDEYAYALVDVGVAYRENVDEVTQVLTEVAEEFRSDERWGSDILDDMEVFGLNALSDSSVDIRVRFKVVAGRQWAVRREFLRRVKYAFDERGIEIPFPHRTLYFGVDKEGEAPPARLLIDNQKPGPDDGGGGSGEKPTKPLPGQSPEGHSGPLADSQE